MNTAKTTDLSRLLNSKVENITDICDLFNPGIYRINCKVNGKVYIGESTVICARIGSHFNQLAANKHHCRELQADWNNFGTKAFECFVLEVGQKYTNSNVWVAFGNPIEKLLNKC